MVTQMVVKAFVNLVKTQYKVQIEKRKRLMSTQLFNRLKFIGRAVI